MSDTRVDPTRVLTGNMVELDAFVPAPTRYKLVEPGGTERSFEVPGDLPFELALGLPARYDDLMAATQAPDAEREQAMDAAWGRLTALLERAVTILDPEASLEGFGYATLLAFASALITRMQLQQSGFTVEAFLQQLLDALPKVPESPKARTSSGSSARSGKSSAGRTTTGGRSAGASSGRPRGISSAPPL